MVWTNWGRNQRVAPRQVLRARDAGEIADTVKHAARDGLRIKVVGSGHSFTGIAVARDVQLSLAASTSDVRIDAGRGTVTVPAGLSLRELNPLLWQHGLSMTNLGDIDAQTVAGAISTGTHGTGLRYRGLADQVRGLKIVLADGSVVCCSRAERPELFSSARLGLGALGILATVTLQCEPAYHLRAREQPLPLAEVISRIDEFAESNDHFEFFWFPHTEVAATKRNNRTGDRAPVRTRVAELIGDEVIGNGAHELLCRLGRRAPGIVPRINRIMAKRMAAADYVDSSHKVYTSPRRVHFVEMEYAIPRDAIRDALRGLRRVAETYARDVTFPVEVRFAAADDVPLSTAYNRESAYLAVHVYRGSPYQAYFAAVEAVMNDLDGRPHWGKLHTQSAETLRGKYPRFDAFVALRDELDPEGRFSNDYLDRVLGRAPGAR